MEVKTHPSRIPPVLAILYAGLYPRTGSLYSPARDSIVDLVDSYVSMRSVRSEIKQSKSKRRKDHDEKNERIVPLTVSRMWMLLSKFCRMISCVSFVVCVL